MILVFTFSLLWLNVRYNVGILDKLTGNYIREHNKHEV